MTLAQFREYMGIKAEEYPEFKKLNARVISEPTKRINSSDVADITVTAHLCRDGRKVTGLYFSVEHKKQTTLQFVDLEEDSIFRFAKVPITQKLQQEYLAIRPQSEIALCIERANEYGEELEKAGKVASYGAIYRKSITEGWHNEHEKNKSLKTLVKEGSQKQQIDIVKEENDAKKRREDNAKYWEQFVTLSATEQTEITMLAIENDSIAKKLFADKGRDNSVVKSLILLHLKKEGRH